MSPVWEGERPREPPREGERPREPQPSKIDTPVNL